MQFDAGFPADYECEILEQLPNRVSPKWYFPGGTELGGRDGLIVSVQPLCVVARGQGCIVEITSPREIETISMEPILGVLPAPAAGFIHCSRTDETASVERQVLGPTAAESAHAHRPRLG